MTKFEVFQKIKRKLSKKKSDNISGINIFVCIYYILYVFVVFIHDVLI